MMIFDLSDLAPEHVELTGMGFARQSSLAGWSMQRLGKSSSR
jgi:hypothetical protein